MTRYVVTLAQKVDRERAHKIIDAAPPMSRVEIKGARRTGAQNDFMWALLTDVATQVAWRMADGTPTKLRPEDWKDVFLDALNREVRLVEAIDGHGVVSLGRSSSDLGKDEFSDLIEVIRMFGAAHGVKFADDEVAA